MHFKQEAYCSKPLILGVWDLCSFSAKLDLGTSGTRFIFVVKFYELIDERDLHSALLLQIFSWDIMKTCGLQGFTKCEVIQDKYLDDVTCILGRKIIRGCFFNEIISLFSSFVSHTFHHIFFVS